jgi:transposase-like protein
MAEAIVRCPHCQSEAVVKYGKASNGKERFRCQRSERCGRTFLQTYAYSGCLPAVKRQIVEMTLNGSGVRDIARVLQVGPNTVLRELKKSGRALTGKHKRPRRVLSLRDHSRSAPRGSGGGR